MATIRRCGVYMIKNLSNQKIYIGSSVHIKKRIEKHKGALRKKMHGNSYIQEDWNNCGEDFFETSIIELCEEKLLLDRETYWVSFYDTLNPDKGYNYHQPNDKKIHRAPKEQKRNGRHKIKYFFINKITSERIESTLTDFHTEKEIAVPLKKFLHRMHKCMGYWKNNKDSQFSYMGWIVVHPNNYNPNFDYGRHNGRLEYLKNLVRKPKKPQKSQAKKPEDIVPYPERNIKRTPVIAEGVKTGINQTFRSIADMVEVLKLSRNRVDECLKQEFKKRSHHGYWFKRV